MDIRFKLYPYPVLTYYSDDYIDCAFNTNIELKKDGYNTAFVIALGKPTERVYLTDVKNGDIKYFRDEKDDHAVPKYSLDELII